MDKDELDKLLASIHVETAKAILSRIKSGEAVAADFVAAMRFLKDNAFEVDPAVMEPTTELNAVVPFPSREAG